MKKKAIGIVIAAILCLSGCGNASGVSQEEYDALKQQLEEMQKSSEDVKEAVEEKEESEEVVEETEEEEEKKEEKKEEEKEASNSGNSVVLKKDNTEQSTDVESDEEKSADNSADNSGIELVNSYYSVYNNGKYTHIPYVVEIKNPNQEMDAQFPKISVVIRDDGGAILASEEQTLMVIAAGDTIIFGKDEFYEGGEPASVDISVSCSRFDNHNPNKVVKQSDFTFSNASEQGGSFPKITGEITNNSDVDFSTVQITIAYSKDGVPVGAESGFVSDVNAGSTAIFDISASSYIKDYDSIELYANQW